MNIKNRKAVAVAKVLFGIGVALGALWWAFFALKPYEITPAEVSALYSYGGPDRREPVVQLGVPERIVVGTTPAWAAQLLYTSFDGAPVVGRVVYPSDPALHAATG